MPCFGVIECRWPLVTHHAVAELFMTVEEATRRAHEVLPAAVDSIDRLGREEPVIWLEVEDGSSRDVPDDGATLPAECNTY
jgi:hypothetical protein